MNDFQHHNLEKRKDLGRENLIQAILFFKTRNFSRNHFQASIVCAFFFSFLFLGWLDKIVTCQFYTTYLPRKLNPAHQPNDQNQFFRDHMVGTERPDAHLIKGCIFLHHVTDGHLHGSLNPLVHGTIIVPPSHTHTHTFSLSLTHTHTHTHTRFYELKFECCCKILKQ